MLCFRSRLPLALFSLLLLISINVTAQIPRTISFQGVLADASGQLLADGIHSLELRLYAQATGGAVIFTETHSVAVVNGVFNAIIGSNVAFPSSVVFDRAYFLGVSVDGGSELSPRTALTAVPYALRAAVADVAQSLAPTASGVITELINNDGSIGVTQPTGPVTTVNVGIGGIATAHLADDAVTSTKLADDAVTSAKVADGSITNLDISGSGATSGQVLSFDGSSVNWTTPTSGLDLPDSITASSGRSLLALTNTGVGSAADIRIARVSSTSPSLKVSTTGIGTGITVQLTNASNGARGIEVTQAGVGPGVFATSAGGNAVWGITSSISAAGVIADNTFGEAVVGRNRGGNGVGAVVGRNDSSGYGVRGFNTKNGIGVLGQSGISGGTGVAGRFENVNASNTQPALQAVTNASNGIAAAFTGRVTISSNLSVTGTLSKGAGSFRIDHPLDPENKYLYHSFVESPDMMNIYNGVVVLDSAGQAWVELPEWFGALNRDFRYQLTSIGAPGPNLYIASEVADNRFGIAGGKAGGKVSWQVTGIRQDTFANENRIPVEEEKPIEEKGKKQVEVIGAPALSLPSTPSR